MQRGVYLGSRRGCFINTCLEVKLWGGSCRKVGVEEVDLFPVNDPQDPEE